MACIYCFLTSYSRIKWLKTTNFFLSEFLLVWNPGTALLSPLAQGLPQAAVQVSAKATFNSRLTKGKIHFQDYSHGCWPASEYSL